MGLSSKKADGILSAQILEHCGVGKNFFIHDQDMRREGKEESVDAFHLTKNTKMQHKRPAATNLSCGHQKKLKKKCERHCETDQNI